MDLRKLKTLIELVESSGIAELEIQEGEERVRITRTAAPAAAAPVAALPGGVPPGCPRLPRRQPRPHPRWPPRPPLATS